MLSGYSLEGVVLGHRKTDNEEYYGKKGLEIEDILDGAAVPRPSDRDANELYDLLALVCPGDQYHSHGAPVGIVGIVLQDGGSIERTCDSLCVTGDCDGRGASSGRQQRRRGCRRQRVRAPGRFINSARRLPRS